MILNIDGFNSTPTEIKKFGAGALVLKNQDTLQKGLLLKTSLTEVFEENIPIIFAQFWFYYEGTNGRFFSINEDKLNLIIEDGILRVTVGEQNRNVCPLTPNEWHRVFVKSGTGINAFWNIEVDGHKMLEVTESFEPNYFVVFRSEGDLKTYFDDFVLSDSFVHKTEINDVYVSKKLNRFWNKKITNSNNALVCFSPQNKNVDAYKIKIYADCEGHASYSLQTRHGGRLSHQTAFSQDTIEKIILPQKNIQFCVYGNAEENGQITLQEIQVQSIG